MKVLSRINANVDRINPYQPGRPIEEVAREMGLDPEGIVKLASNESALGVAPSAQKAIVKWAEEAHRYPDGQAYALRKKLAAHYDLPGDNFIMGSGSNEVLVFLAQCLMGEGTSVVASQYAFAIYKILSVMTGTDFIEVPAKGLGHDLDAILAAIRPDTTIVFVTNPNNPTGTMVTAEEIDAFMEKVPDHVLVVFDEAYAEICLGEMPDTLKFVRQGRPVIVLRTFSKAYGLAGLRIGYGIADKQIIAALEKPRQPFNTTLIAQVAAEAALDDKQFLEDSRATYMAGRDLLEKGFEKLGLNYERTYANFILFEVPDAASINQELTKRGVIVRPVAPYGLGNYLRVSLGTLEENQAFLDALEDCLK